MEVIRRSVGLQKQVDLGKWTRRMASPFNEIILPKMPASAKPQQVNDHH